jgi:MoaA/NifB/PqqE/SkfB family radical SAM enzyme
MSNTYCPLAWIGRNILPTSIQPCCEWYGIGDPVDSAENIGHSPVFLNAREKMSKGEKVAGCKQCYLAEESGIKSRRLQALEQYGVVDTVESRVLDVSFDNICNLKCRGCASSSSHLWFSDEKEIYSHTIFGSKYVENNTNIDISGLEYVGVSGGEPFLSKKFNSFAEKLLSTQTAKNICLTINTNATVKPSPAVYDLILTCKNLSLQFSIDGIGHLNSYFRSGATFEECEKNLNFFRNLKTLRQEKSTSLVIHTTVSLYNVNLLKDMEDYFQTNYPEYALTHRNLYWPPQLSIRNLPQPYKEILIPIVENFGDNYKDVLYELILNEQDYFNHFLNFHDKLDLLRKESLKDSNPLLSEFIKNYPRELIDSKIFFIEQMDKLKCGT